ncbi:hypothetical protein RvY_16944 [Ramazzottius varieornatus]|uniref:Cytochrome P450 n=1 Tax=Ramazzottius varieornatus TaxID=947166 RepID=A0A1D1W0B0_RAMVA|nr:hypothetical protein RvY_16944 [Ramazzottius varieornatus]
MNILPDILPWYTSIAFLVFLTLGYYWKNHHGTPDGPRGVPLLGFAPFFGPSSQDTFLSMKEEYGKIFSIRAVHCTQRL